MKVLFFFLVAAQAFCFSAPSQVLLHGGISNGMLNLSWSGPGNINLQANTNLSGGHWDDQSNTLGQNAAALPLNQPQQFFRLKMQPVVGVSLGRANLGFEADGTNTFT